MCPSSDEGLHTGGCWWQITAPQLFIRTPSTLPQYIWERNIKNEVGLSGWVGGWSRKGVGVGGGMNNSKANRKWQMAGERSGEGRRREGCWFQHHGQRRRSRRSTFAGKWMDLIPFLHWKYCYYIHFFCSQILPLGDSGVTITDYDIGYNDMKQKWLRLLFLLRLLLWKRTANWQRSSRIHRVKRIHDVYLIFMTGCLSDTLFWVLLAIQILFFSRKGIIPKTLQLMCSGAKKKEKKKCLRLYFCFQK